MPPARNGKFLAQNFKRAVGAAIEGASAHGYEVVGAIIDQTTNEIVIGMRHRRRTAETPTSLIPESKRPGVFWHRAVRVNEGGDLQRSSNQDQQNQPTESQSEAFRRSLPCHPYLPDTPLTVYAHRAPPLRRARSTRPWPPLRPGESSASAWTSSVAIIRKSSPSDSYKCGGRRRDRP